MIREGDCLKASPVISKTALSAYRDCQKVGVFRKGADPKKSGQEAGSQTLEKLRQVGWGAVGGHEAGVKGRGERTNVGKWQRTGSICSSNQWHSCNIIIMQSVSAPHARAPLHPFPKPLLIPSIAPKPASLLLATFPCSLTPLTTLSRPVSTTTPPTIISPKQACSVS